MELTVKLYGTLSRSFDTYDHSGGLAVSLSEGASVKDLLACLNLQPEGIGMIFINGRPAKMKTGLNTGEQIKIFQPIFGG